MAHNDTLMRIWPICTTTKRARKGCIPSKKTVRSFASDVAGLVGSLRKQNHPTR